MITLDNSTWLITIFSLIGGQLVIQKKKSGYAIWILMNFLWMAFFLYKGIYSSSALFLVYFAQSCYGYFKWHKNKTLPQPEKYNKVSLSV
ncbi:MAG TPA: nicotinamide mononucleotide transporter [Aquella sp.]|nr:nicotinamide mononucleotide transporter [Aquella sp.]